MGMPIQYEIGAFDYTPEGVAAQRERALVKERAASRLADVLAGRVPSAAAERLAGESQQQRAEMAAAFPGASLAQRRAGMASVGASAPSREVLGAVAQSQWGSADAALGQYGALQQDVIAQGQLYNQQLAAENALRGKKLNEALNWRNALGGILSSDRNAKRNLRDGRDEADALLAALRPTTFAYRDEPDNEPAHLGVVAQDVERGGPLGRAIVGRDEDGMRFLRGDAGVGAVVSMLGRLEERLSRVEKARR